MCLAVYLGTSRPLALPRETKPGHLGIKAASWTPPPLERNHPFVYYVGRKGDGDVLECSCLLAEHVHWEEGGPRVNSDALYPDDPPCPFETLKGFCAEATAEGGVATIVCDDGGGAEQHCTEGDYALGGLVKLESIARGGLLFADANGGFPWRVLHVINTDPRALTQR